MTAVILQASEVVELGAILREVAATVYAEPHRMRGEGVYCTVCMTEGAE